MLLARRLSCCVLSVAMWVAASAGYALDLTLPGEAELTREIDRDADTYFLPVGPYASDTLPTKELEGRVVRQAWQVEGTSLSTLQLLQTIRTQLQTSGYEILLDCTGAECGGFDFRFGTEVLPGPDMFVDLFDFRFLSAHNASVAGAEYVSALVSRAGEANYVQLIVVGSEDTTDIEVTATATATEPTPPPQPTTDIPLAQQLVTEGHVVLPDLEFATGSADLTDRSYASLAALAAYLKANEKRRVALVGHTDSVGALEDNVALSQRRAASVLERLVTRHDVPQGQLESNGMGYLAPIASNISAEGREANRRVEAVLLEVE